MTRRYYWNGHLALCGLFFTVSFTLIAHIHLNTGLGNSKVPEVTKPLKYVVLHLDFKGAPLNIEYLFYLLRPLKWMDVNALLLEYEDMFPYNGTIANISTPFHYTSNQLQRFLTEAALMKFELIPLIQTFGHMEHVLKLKEFKHLREQPLFPDSICPSNAQSQQVIEEMVKQVITFHKRFAPLKYVHIGCDEVYRINKCKMCIRRNLGNKQLYFSHVTSVAKIVKKYDSEAKILIWDDLMRGDIHNYENELKKLATNNVEPVYWDYTPTLDHVKHTHLFYYQKCFGGIWAASAFKGADGQDVTTPNMTRRFMNNLNWMQTIYLNRPHYEFRGIILTGWSRYSHFQPLSELLPLSYRTLFPILNLLSKFKFGLQLKHRGGYTNDDWTEVSELYSDGLKKIDRCKERHRKKSEACRFNDEITMELRKSVKDLIKTLKEVDNWNKEHDVEALVKFEYYKSIHELNDLKNSTLQYKRMVQVKKSAVVKHLKHFYGENVYNEYLSYKIYPVKNKIERNLKMISVAINKRVWNRGREFKKSDYEV